MENKSL